MQSAVHAGQHFLVDKWVPGLLTNFTEVRQAILQNAATLQQQGERFLKKKPRIARRVLGLQNMSEKPDLLIILNVKENMCAVREAQAANVPIMAICDSDCDPQDIAWPIPANDDHLASVGLITTKIADALREATSLRNGTASLGTLAAQSEPKSELERAYFMPDDKLLLKNLTQQHVEKGSMMSNDVETSGKPQHHI